ncbi:MAG: TolC family outer membrane protein [Proteobacteria bacterium]|nr:TolC family outer membrane protein [Pseudomonadota bacterium]
MPLLRPPLLSALALAATLLLGSGAQAQSLKDLYEAARPYDAAFLSAQALYRSADYRVAAIEGIARPQAALSGSATTSRIDPPIGGSGDSNALAANLTGRYAVINRSNDAIIAQARKTLEIAKADLETAEQDLLLRVSQAYFDVLAAQDTLGTVRANKAAITEQLASAKRNFEVGTATITDTREAQARYDKAQADEIAADNDLRTKRIALDQLVGRSSTEPRPLALPAVLPPIQPADVEAWVGSADAQHPTVRRARVAVDIAQLETEKARAAEKFTLDAVGSVGAQRLSGSTLSGLPGTTRTATIGLQFNWPLYTGGSTQNSIQEKLLLEEKARQDLDTARRAIAQGTRVAYFGVQSGQAQVKALEAAEASSKLALEATQLGYRVGVRVNLDVLNAQTALYQTQRDLAKARYDVLVNTLRLRQAAGQLAAGDIEAINALLAR